MASTLSKANVFNLTNRLEPARAEQTEQKAKQKELAISLIQSLQASLEIEEILNLFLNQVRSLVPVDGLSYIHENADIQFASAIQGKHKVSYQLNTDKEGLGLIAFTRHRRYVESELESLESLMSCLLFPLRNALKYHHALKAATTDALTTCGNRQALESSLLREINLAQRDDIPMSVIMFDFDHFKKINDNYGHQCGDYVLKRASMDIKNMIRKTDLLFRYGGEEFVILLHKTNLAGARIVAEKIRKQIEAESITFQDQPLKATVSLGVATLNEDDGISSIIERADKALYAAKNEGRNRISVSE